jgi:hypothetical protein
VTARPRVAPPALRAWYVSRGAVLALMALATWLQVRHGYGRAPVRPGGTAFLAWDGDWYRDIATSGYDSPDAVRFFPLYPMLARPFAPLGPVAVGVVLVAVANAAALAYAEGLVRLARLELGETAAGRVPWLALLNPAAFVLAIAYAEALAAALAVWCVYALRRQRWLLAAALGFAVGLARPVGLLLAVPALVEAVRVRSRAGLVPRALAVAAPPLGCAAYLLWCRVAWGDALLPFRVQQRSELRSGVLTLPTREIARAWRALLELGPWNLALRLVWIPVLLALLAVTARRLPASYVLYAAPILLVALGTPRLASFERYALSAFPLLLAAASLRSRLVAVTLGASWSLALGLYAILGFANRYVP